MHKHQITAEERKLKHFNQEIDNTFSVVDPKKQDFPELNYDQQLKLMLDAYNIHRQKLQELETNQSRTVIQDDELTFVKDLVKYYKTNATCIIKQMRPVL